ncbi:MAG: 50S ribosomal protein L6 [Nanoarchaeota archaeon]|nr:50S ribosomal protein L6 [Nanoarchaeota archaeon]MBU1632760.1 50S ribosomal protein L6 [Nanoarchaeota archaeon]MBU1876400.1 50S ribosomal protein L6 [Nanoarchaeota archaeon]
MKKEIKLKENINAQLDGVFLIVKGPKGEVKRTFAHPKIVLSVEKDKLILDVKKATRREKAVINSFEAHIYNMITGVEEPHVYKLKICSGHFPMTVSVSGNELTIKNFLGEAVPRKVKFIVGAEVKIDGNEIIVSSPDKEAAGQTAAKIESLCRITDRDKRIFQDGCYIINKAGKIL